MLFGRDGRLSKALADTVQTYRISKQAATATENKKVFVLFMELRSPWAVSDIRSEFSILLTKKLLSRLRFFYHE